nr:MAG TPA: hypothetical protein [Caudoviricetes sp.]
MPSDLIHLDGVAYSASIDGQYVPCSTQTAIFKTPERTNIKRGVTINTNS